VFRAEVKPHVRADARTQQAGMRWRLASVLPTVPKKNRLMAGFPSFLI
jgi:hypothetical protein